MCNINKKVITLFGPSYSYHTKKRIKTYFFFIIIKLYSIITSLLYITTTATTATTTTTTTITISICLLFVSLFQS